jgi:flagellar assembly protein FliH
MTSSSEPATLALDQFDGAAVFRPGRRRVDVDPAVERAASDAVARGWKAGHAAGWQAGFEQGREAASRQIARVLDSLSAAAADLRCRAAVDMAEAEDAIVAGAVELAELLIGREISLTADPGADAIARALALVPGDAGITVRLSPVDAGHLGPGAVPAGREITLVADATVETGGCVVEAGATSIDAQLGPALARARAFLLDGRPA